MWTIFKVFIEFVTILLLFWFFGCKACGIPIPAPRPGMEPAPPVLEGEVLTTGPPGKSFPLCLMSPFDMYDNHLQVKCAVST